MLFTLLATKFTKIQGALAMTSQPFMHPECFVIKVSYLAARDIDCVCGNHLAPNAINADHARALGPGKKKRRGKVIGTGLVVVRYDWLLQLQSFRDFRDHKRIHTLYFRLSVQTFLWPLILNQNSSF